MKFEIVAPTTPWPHIQALTWLVHQTVRAMRRLGHTLSKGATPDVQIIFGAHMGPLPETPAKKRVLFDTEQHQYWYTDEYAARAAQCDAVWTLFPREVSPETPRNRVCAKAHHLYLGGAGAVEIAPNPKSRGCPDRVLFRGYMTPHRMSALDTLARKGLTPCGVYGVYDRWILAELRCGWEASIHLSPQHGQHLEVVRLAEALCAGRAVVAEGWTPTACPWAATIRSLEDLREYYGVVDVFREQWAAFAAVDYADSIAHALEAL